MSASALSHFFKPDVKTAGEKLFAGDNVVLKQATDKQLEGYVTSGSTLSKVAFSSHSISDNSFLVDCSCTHSKKGQLCKHIWAMLLKADEKSVDFLENKTTLEKATRFREKEEAALKQKAATSTPAYVSPKQEEYKQKQAAYRKQAYQAQKERAKDSKKVRAKASSKTQGPALSPEIQDALKYFEVNGFPMTLPIEPEKLQSAKRVLSRVFHPDKGGTNEEIVELLRHTDTLLES